MMALSLFEQEDMFLFSLVADIVPSSFSAITSKIIFVLEGEILTNEHCSAVPDVGGVQFIVDYQRS